MSVIVSLDSLGSTLDYSGACGGVVNTTTCILGVSTSHSAMTLSLTGITSSASGGTCDLISELTTFTAAKNVTSGQGYTVARGSGERRLCHMCMECGV